QRDDAVVAITLDVERADRRIVEQRAFAVTLDVRVGAVLKLPLARDVVADREDAGILSSLRIWLAALVRESHLVSHEYLLGVSSNCVPGWGSKVGQVTCRT